MNAMSDKKILNRIFSYAWEKKGLYIFAILLYSLQEFAFGAYVTFAQYSAIDMVENDKLNQISGLVIKAVLLYAAIIAFICIGMILIDYVNITIDNRLKNNLLKCLLSKKIVIANKQMDDLQQSLLNDSSAVSSFLTYTVSAYASPIITLIGFSFILTRLHVLFLAVIVLVAAVQIVYNLSVKPGIKRLEKAVVDLNTRYLAGITEQIRSISNIKLFSLFDYVKSKNSVINLVLRKSQLLKSLINNLRTLLSNLLYFAVCAAALIFAIRKHSEGQFSLSAISIIPGLLGGVFASIEGLLSLSVNLQQPLASARHMLQVIDDGNQETAIIPDEAKTALPSPEAIALELENLDFSYDEKTLFKRFGFQIRKGEIVRISGGIGRGKSTLIKLIMGFLEPQQGKIRAFGVDKSSVSESEWLRNFAYVEQEPVLFNLTIQENIEIGNLKQNQDSVPAQASESDNEKLNHILEITGINEMAEALPAGLKTPVGNRGTALSGGQRQLICLARALYSDSPILILDEFSASMDKRIEEKILNVLNMLKGEKTILYISHKSNSGLASDRVILLD